jgi:DNA polymerase III epsilon subunit-like protein
MKVLIFDTETTGLPKNQKAEPSIMNIDDWPYIVQLSWILYDTDTCNLISESDNIIKLENNVEISEESINIHKITKQICKTKGVYLSDVLQKFMKNFQICDLCVAHNMQFDNKILIVEMIRNLLNHKKDETGFNSKLVMWQTFSNSKKMFCTMQETVDLCNIKAISSKFGGKEYVKFPTLGELHEYYFGYKPKNLHNAFTDVMICVRCFHMLKFGKDICEENIKFRRFVNKIHL